MTQTSKRRLACLVLSLAMALSLCACGKTDGVPSGPDASGTPGAADPVGGPGHAAAPDGTNDRPAYGDGAVNEYIREMAAAYEVPVTPEMDGRLESVRIGRSDGSGISDAAMMPVDMTYRIDHWCSPGDLTGAGLVSAPSSLYPGAVELGYEAARTPMLDWTDSIGKAVDKSKEDYAADYERFLMNGFLILSVHMGFDAMRMTSGERKGLYDSLSCTWLDLSDPYGQEVSVEVSDGLNGLKVSLGLKRPDGFTEDDCLLLYDMFGIPITLDELEHMAGLAKQEAEGGTLGTSIGSWDQTRYVDMYLSVDYFADGGGYELSCSRSVNVLGANERADGDVTYRDLLESGQV